jgi:hypothetical protein
MEGIAQIAATVKNTSLNTTTNNWRSHMKIDAEPIYTDWFEFEGVMIPTHYYDEMTLKLVTGKTLQEMLNEN